MKLTNCNALIWNLKCRGHTTTTNYLTYFKVVTTLLQGGKCCKSRATGIQGKRERERKTEMGTGKITIIQPILHL